jgi:hypothetical protein
MSKCTSGVCLMLTLLAIFASAALSTGSGGNIFFVIGTLLMAPMCYFAEKFDGGTPAFYEEMHQ